MSRRPRATSTNERQSKSGVLASLRQLLRTRRSLPRVSIRPRKSTAAVPDSSSTPGGPANPNDTTSEHTPPAPSSWTPHKSLLSSAGLATAINMMTNGSLNTAPAPPHDPDASGSDEDDSLNEASESRPSSADALDGSARQDGEKEKDGKGKKGKKGTKKTKRKSTWVAKLLNEVVPAPKDRVYSRKKRKQPVVVASGACHEVLRVAEASHAILLGHVFDFLLPLEPAQLCVTVNKALARAVAQYYAKHCEWPRPRAYLAHQVLSFELAGKTGVLSRVLEMLPIVDRVHASSTSRAFQREADALALEFKGSLQASTFLRVVSPDRIEQRFPHTKILRCVATESREAVQLLQMMSEGDGDHFVSLEAIELRNFRGFPSEGLFVQLVQSLFSDRISLSLRTLSLSDLKLEDQHYRQLARLFYDGHFPVLATLDVSHNLFSSRFMRDWARSFHEDRFATLRCLDITAVGMGVEDMLRFFKCLRNVPQLQTLRVSHNLCSLASLQMLSDIITECHLAHLQELSCSAICGADHALAVLVDALRTPHACIALRHLDLSGNELSAGAQTMRSLARAFSSSSWPQLSYLNLSFTMPTQEAFQLFTHELANCPSTALREMHLGGNQLHGDAFESLILAMENKALRNLELLNLSDNRLDALDFELLSACLTSNSCPSLRELFLAGNAAQSAGLTHFRRFFRSAVAEKLHTLDISGNAIPPPSLAMLADELLQCDCQQLQILNVSRNLELRSVVRFQKLIRSNKCPSLACLQVGYAQSRSQGYDFVRTVRSRMSVEELRRLKQLKFEARMKKIEEDNIEKAARAAIRCKRQTRLLREMYDHMESQADRALRRRKRVRKSPHLHIHEEIAQLKQDKYHAKIRRQLERAMASPQVA